MQMLPTRMTRYCFTVLILVAVHGAAGQSLLNVRSIGMASDMTTAYDLPALFSNPAGITSIRNWQINNTNALLTNPANAGQFGSVGIGYRFYHSHVAAFTYAPSRVMQFRFLTTKSREEIRTGQWTSIIYEVISDKRLRYQEAINIGYATTAMRGLSFGVAARWLQQDIDEVATTIKRESGVSSTANVNRTYSESSTWNFDAGVIFTPAPAFQFALVANNVLSVRERELYDVYKYYSLDPEKVIRFGASVRPVEDFLMSAEYDTKSRAGFGVELNALEPSSPFVLRLGARMDFATSRPIQAISFGAGYAYKFITVDAAYVTFLDKSLRTSIITEDQFVPLTNVEYNDYVRDRFALSLSINLGTLRDAMARIEHVELAESVFPASYRMHAVQPLGTARVRNLTNQPIHIRLRYYVRKLMDLPTETGDFFLGPEEVKDIPFTAEFNESILANRFESLRESEVGVVVSQVDDYEDVVRTKLLVHGRNSWNGDPLLLKYFITPKDPVVAQFTRRAVAENRDAIESCPVSRRRFEQARIVFERLANLLTYVSDPSIGAGAKERENVQYPNETLDLRSGDCEDLTVCYAAMLSNLGIETAFVDVRSDSTAADGSNAHVYLLFDTGSPVAQWQAFSTNEKKFAFRTNSTGRETLWIPIETTRMKNGFDDAWSRGAAEYYRDVEVQLGLLRGVVKIVDVNAAE